MKGEKFFRLFLGLIILFSIFLFQGSEHHDGCTQCEENGYNGALKIINDSSEMIRITIMPIFYENVLTATGNLSTVSISLKEGIYQVIAFYVVMGDPERITGILGMRVVDIKRDKPLTITFK